jgi:hypothetical protein
MPVSLGATYAMSIQAILDKIPALAGKLLAFFIIFFTAGFIYGVVKTKNNRIDDIIAYVKVDYTDYIPSSLSVSCSSTRPSYVYNIPTGNILPDPAAKEEALSSFKTEIAQAMPTNPGPVMTTGAGIFGFGAAWEGFKMGHGNIKDGLIIALGAVFGFPLGYHVSTQWMEMNCPSEDLFKLLDKDDTWRAIVDTMFLRLYNEIYEHCSEIMSDRSKFDTLVKQMDDKGFDTPGRHYSYEDFSELTAMLADCQK